MLQLYLKLDLWLKARRWLRNGQQSLGEGAFTVCSDRTVSPPRSWLKRLIRRPWSWCSGGRGGCGARGDPPSPGREGRASQEHVLAKVSLCSLCTAQRALLPARLLAHSACKDSSCNMIRATLAPRGSPGRSPTPPRSSWVPLSRAQLCTAPRRPDVRLRPGIPGGLRGRLEYGASVCREVAESKGGEGHSRQGALPTVRPAQVGGARGGGWGRSATRGPRSGAPGWSHGWRGDTPCTGEGAPLQLGPSPSVCASPQHTPLALRRCVSPSAFVCLSLAPWLSLSLSLCFLSAYLSLSVSLYPSLSLKSEFTCPPNNPETVLNPPCMKPFLSNSWE